MDTISDSGNVAKYDLLVDVEKFFIWQIDTRAQKWRVYFEWADLLSIKIQPCV